MKVRDKIALIWVALSTVFAVPLVALSPDPQLLEIVFQGVVAITAAIQILPWMSTRFACFGALRALLWPFDRVTSSALVELERAQTREDVFAVLRGCGLGSGKVFWPYGFRLGLIWLAFGIASTIMPEPLLGIQFGALFMIFQMATLSLLIFICTVFVMARERT